MKRNILIIIGVLCVVLITVVARKPGNAEKQPQEPIPAELAVREPNIRTEQHVIESGETLNGILQRNAGLGAEDAFKTVAQIQESFDVTRIRTGDVIEFTFTDDVFSQLSFDINNEEMLVAHYSQGLVETERKNIEYEVREATAQVTISSSLYLDGVAAGMTDRGILDLAQIFSWDIDFTTNIQENDNFSVTYQNRYRDGEFVGVGDILAARFNNEGKDYYAFLVDDGESKKYYDQNGKAKERLLLKTPLNYSRVSSGFSAGRIHPISGYVRKHQGVDFAAPTGTPIESVGDGTVTYAGTNGGYGKFIKIKHGGGFETAYAHLSTIAVKKGQKVSQGEYIGKVGSTGASTGPHLHYEVIRNGSHTNPLTVNLPDGDALPEDLVDVFEKNKQQYVYTIQ